jgi:hypothetical protein
MKPAGALLLALFATPLAAQESRAPEPEIVTEVARSFLDCAVAYRRSLANPDGDKRFGCTEAYLQCLPGSGGSTLDMATATARATEVADFYVDNMLFSEIVLGLAPEEGAEGRSSNLTRHFLLQSYVRSARAAGQTLCDLYYDYFSEGTIRSVMAGSCAVANRDKLIDDLLRLADTIGTE